MVAKLKARLKESREAKAILQVRLESDEVNNKELINELFQFKREAVE